MWGRIVAVLFVVSLGSVSIPNALAQFDFGGAFRDSCHYLNFNSSTLAGFGVPFDVFSQDERMLFEVACHQDHVQVSAGDGSPTTYVYQRGYVWKQGAWQPVTFSPQEKRVGDWLVGRAEATIPFSNAELKQRQYLVGYTCQWINQSWKCGCANASCATSSWQLQTFSYEANSISPEKLYEVLPDELKLPQSPVMSVMLSPQSAGAGTKVTVQGFGFEKPDTTVAFSRNGSVVANAPVAYIGTMSQYQGASAGSFTVPNVTPGLYRLSMHNPEGNEKTEHFFVVSGGGAAPTISSFSPSEGPYGTTVTLYGNNFSDETIVYNSYGGHQVVRAHNNGTRLTFSLEPYAGSKQTWYEQGLLPTFIPLYLHVITDHGFSNQVGPFTIH